MISKELRVEVLAEAKRNKAGTVESVQRMYRKRLEKSEKRGHLPASVKAAYSRQIERIPEEFAL
ncbi:hypothetical protein EH240_33425 [Mesorhizobium tamadayense]|uniref:Uncharacterized protein n=1 Tax=Mesorhizobium tamadayense TaxID=425306 RepID=A0A3P3EVP3_9HYPH|nr:hypothetical protein [Mesorhizobium tamadayense]RRH90106.1 hypothetical protein EH240_33425 [Mesorhizobium tamadayense]